MAWLACMIMIAVSGVRGVVPSTASMEFGLHMTAFIRIRHTQSLASVATIVLVQINCKAHPRAGSSYNHLVPGSLRKNYKGFRSRLRSHFGGSRLRPGTCQRQRLFSSHIAVLVLILTIVAVFSNIISHISWRSCMIGPTGSLYTSHCPTSTRLCMSRMLSLSERSRQRLDTGPAGRPASWLRLGLHPELCHGGRQDNAWL